MLIKEISLNLDKLGSYQEWKKANGDDFSLWDYLFGVANVEIALGFAKLFWPDFVEYEGGVFLSESFDIDIYKQWQAKLGNDIGAIERAINHQHLDDLLPGAEEVGIDNLLYLGQTMAEMWENRLRLLYPERRFHVASIRDEQTVTVSFYQL